MQFHTKLFSLFSIVNSVSTALWIFYTDCSTTDTFAKNTENMCQHEGNSGNWRFFYVKMQRKEEKNMNFSQRFSTRSNRISIFFMKKVSVVWETSELLLFSQWEYNGTKRNWWSCWQWLNTFTSGDSSFLFLPFYNV